MLSNNQSTSNIALDDVCFVARRVLAMIKDPRTNSERLARVIDAVQALSEMVLDAANDIFAERGRVGTTAMAITVIGFNRLEALTRRFLYAEFERLSAAVHTMSVEDPLEVSLPVPMMAGEKVGYNARYAAMA